jgi:hypothetical protein
MCKLCQNHHFHIQNTLKTPKITSNSPLLYVKHPEKHHFHMQNTPKTPKITSKPPKKPLKTPSKTPPVVLTARGTSFDPCADSGGSAEIEDVAGEVPGQAECV